MAVNEKIREFNSCSKIDYPGLVEIDIIGDGSCLIHSILRATNRVYLNSRTLKERKLLSRSLRDTLSNLLGENDPETGTSYYNLLSKGYIAEYSKIVPEYSLEALQKELRSDTALGISLIEFISNIMKKDIYILNAEQGDLYRTGDSDLYFKGRDSIVIIYRKGHFTVLGTRQRDERGELSDTTINTYFTATHPLIQEVRKKVITSPKRDL